MGCPCSSPSSATGSRTRRLSPQGSGRPGVQPPELPAENGGNDVHTPHRTGGLKPAGAPKPPTGKAIVARKSGATLRRMTVYLPLELAKKLQRAALESERDMSAIIAEAVEAWLHPRSGNFLADLSSRKSAPAI